MKTKIQKCERDLSRMLKRAGLIPTYPEIMDGPMTSEQKKTISSYIALVDDPLDAEGLNRQLESGLTCTDAEDMIRMLMGEMRYK